MPKKKSSKFVDDCSTDSSNTLKENTRFNDSIEDTSLSFDLNTSCSNSNSSISNRSNSSYSGSSIGSQKANRKSRKRSKWWKYVTQVESNQ